MLVSRFWWGEVADERKIHWVSWAKFCRPQHLGGLGFQDFAIFNQTLLVKQCWRILENPELFLSRVLKSVYFPSESSLTASGRARPSWGWQIIIHGRNLLLHGLRWQVGSGNLIHLVAEVSVRERTPSSHPFYCARDNRLATSL
ncbi:Uncharacterized mitochondrial protein AtMg00310 [Linum perenne]